MHIENEGGGTLKEKEGAINLNLSEAIKVKKTGLHQFSRSVQTTARVQHNSGMNFSGAL